MYPRSEGSDFDFDYYRDSHMAMVASKLGDACDSWSIDKVTGGQFEAIGYLNVTNLETFGAVMTENREVFTADALNYTTVTPEVVVSEIFATS
jgi:uncharacterized protein (TIGR02118 family)